jgi:hypothetical protein
VPQLSGRGTSGEHDQVLTVDEARMRLSVALDAFESEIPDLRGPDDWPALTPVLAQRLEEVRTLSRASTIGASDGFDVHGINRGRAHWPRRPCDGCGGIGWYWIDPDLTAEGWEPCRRCLTTGLRLTVATQRNSAQRH